VVIVGEKPICIKADNQGTASVMSYLAHAMFDANLNTLNAENLLIAIFTNGTQIVTK
jgi:hypothetical protein